MSVLFTRNVTVASLLRAMVVTFLFVALQGCMSTGGAFTLEGSPQTSQRSSEVNYLEHYKKETARLRKAQVANAVPNLLDGSNTKKVFSVRISGCFSSSKGRVCIDSNNGNRGLYQNRRSNDARTGYDRSKCRYHDRHTSCYGWF